MRANDGTGRSRPHNRSLLSDILQIVAGLALAVFLFQSDRAAIETRANTFSQAVLRKDAIDFGLHMIRLEVVHLAASLGRAIGVD